MLDCLLFMRKTWFQWSRQETIGNQTHEYPISFNDVPFACVTSSIQDKDAAAETCSVGLMPAFDGSQGNLDFTRQFQEHIYYNNSSTTGKMMRTCIIAVGS